MYEIVIYQTNTGKEPYTEWSISLDTMTMARIDGRLTRIRESGNQVISVFVNLLGMVFLN